MSLQDDLAATYKKGFVPRSKSDKDTKLTLSQAIAKANKQPVTSAPTNIPEHMNGFLSSVQDAMPTDTMRSTVLIPTVNSVTSAKQSLVSQKAQVFIAADYAVRQFAAYACRQANLLSQAQILSALPKVIDASTAAAASLAASNAARVADNAGQTVAANACRAAASAASVATTVGNGSLDAQQNAINNVSDLSAASINFAATGNNGQIQAAYQIAANCLSDMSSV
jgi:hypothetical protein